MVVLFLLLLLFVCLLDVCLLDVCLLVVCLLVVIVSICMIEYSNLHRFIACWLDGGKPVSLYYCLPVCRL